MKQEACHRGWKGQSCCHETIHLSVRRAAGGLAGPVVVLVDNANTLIAHGEVPESSGCLAVLMVWGKGRWRNRTHFSLKLKIRHRRDWGELLDPYEL